MPQDFDPLKEVGETSSPNTSPNSLPEIKTQDLDTVLP